jgi:hypothetical protein
LQKVLKWNEKVSLYLEQHFIEVQVHRRSMNGVTGRENGERMQRNGGKRVLKSGREKQVKRVQNRSMMRHPPTIAFRGTISGWSDSRALNTCCQRWTRKPGIYEADQSGQVGD